MSLPFSTVWGRQWRKHSPVRGHLFAQDLMKSISTDSKNSGDLVPSIRKLAHRNFTCLPAGRRQAFRISDLETILWWTGITLGLLGRRSET